MSSTFYHPDYTVGIGFVALAQRTELLLNSTYLVPFLISVMILEKLSFYIAHNIEFHKNSTLVRRSVSSSSRAYQTIDIQNQFGSPPVGN